MKSMRPQAHHVLPLTPSEVADAVAEGVSRAIRKWVGIALLVYIPIWIGGQMVEDARIAKRQARIADALNPKAGQSTMSEAELTQAERENRRAVERLLGK